MTPTDHRAGPGWRPSRAPLAAKLSVAFVELVALVLIVNGVFDTYLTFGQAKRSALEVEAEKARAAAERVGEFLDEIQTQLGWTAGVEWGYAKPEQQRYDFVRLLRQAPAITALSYIDGKGREQLAVSRLEPNAVASGKDFSADPRFVQAVADRIWFGPVEFRRGSEPYMTVALAHVGKTPGVTVADVNLKLVWDVVSAIRVGKSGFAYVVDDKGRLIAHPDLSLVLRNTDFSHLPQVAAALKGRGVSEAEEARSVDGSAVLTAHAVAPKTRWIVFVEQPLAEALATAYSSLLRSLALLGLGLALAAVSGVALARRMAAPIRLLQAGADRLGAGDLAQRLDIRTGDEIEALAGGFNRMAQRLQESYEDLEAKVEARTRDLNGALARQTATAEVLKVISRSAFGLKTVLQTLVDSAVRLCAHDGVIYLRDGEVFRAAASFGAEVAGSDPRNRSPRRPGRDSITGRVALSGHVEQIPDNETDLEFSVDPAQRMAMRALLGVPLLRDGEVEGVFVLAKPDPGAFSDRDVDLVRTFADQAVIAIQNVRLFEEVREALEQQKASAGVLSAIGRSVSDASPVFEEILNACQRLFGSHEMGIYTVDADEMVRVAAWRGERRAEVRHDVTPLAESVTGRIILERRAHHIPDLLAEPNLTPIVRERAERLGSASLLYAPMLWEDQGLGSILVVRSPPQPFSERETEMLRSFADQAAIAIQNARLFEEVQTRTRELEQSLADLRKAQDRLVQSEKLASLGQLTAGIAHEIKNPLNFVNNFVALSRELLDELREPLKRLPEDARGEADDLLSMIDSNLDKVAAHGRRADSIVKNMLLHSREGSGERARVSVNAMVEEALNLGYHGARAEKPGFNVTLEKRFDPNAGDADIYLQEVTRVLLNLISNGFYASAQRKLREGPDYAPTLKASTRDLGPSVEIRIRDNGAGIPDEVRAKIFNPFFTTKPAGEGTGLGLSLSHDIVVKQHGGTLAVETEPGAFTEFIITLPRNGAGA